jgi:hypothetical protein
LAADPAISGSVVGTPKSGGLAVIAALATLLAAALAVDNESRVLRYFGVQV